MQPISIKQLALKQSQEDVDLIDVRMPTEYRAVHAVGAINVPLDSLITKAVSDSVGAGANKRGDVICKTRNRSSRTVQNLQNRTEVLDVGIRNVINVDGGTTVWDGASLMFAGIMDTCGMGMMLLKLSWNQVNAKCQLDNRG